MNSLNEFDALQLYNHVDSYFKEEWWFAIKRWAEDHGFLEVPASVRHHSCEDGGLLIHSMNVLKSLWFLNESWGAGFDKKAMIVAATWHDIGKLGIMTHEGSLVPRYIAENRERPHKWIFNTTMPQQDMRLSSILILRRFITLPFYVEEAIQFHDGPYLPGQMKERAFKQGRLELMLHYADYWSGYVLEQGLGDRGPYGK